MKGYTATPFRISLRAARISNNLSQQDVADSLSVYFGKKLSRQRIAEFENNPAEVPPVYGDALSKLYKIPKDYISFA